MSYRKFYFMSFSNEFRSCDTGIWRLIGGFVSPCRATVVTQVPWVPQEPLERPVPQVPSALPANRATEERR